MITQRLRTAKTHVAFAVMILSGCDGTDHVAEEGASEPELWSADVVVEIGDVEGDERYLFQRIRSGAVIDGGLSIVLADQLGQIRQYSSRTGEWERTLATKGRGPGEVLYVTKLATRGDSLFAWDVGQNRITTFVGGRAVANQNVTAVVGVSSSNSFEVLPNHFAIQIERGQLRSPDPARGWILAVTRTGDQVDTLLGPYPVPEKGWEIIDEETQRARWSIHPP